MFSYGPILSSNYTAEYMCNALSSCHQCYTSESAAWVLPEAMSSYVHMVMKWYVHRYVPARHGMRWGGEVRMGWVDWGGDGMGRREDWVLEWGRFVGGGDIHWIFTPFRAQSAFMGLHRLEAAILLVQAWIQPMFLHWDKRTNVFLSQGVFLRLKFPQEMQQMHLFHSRVLTSCRECGCPWPCPQHRYGHANVGGMATLEPKTTHLKYSQ